MLSGQEVRRVLEAHGFQLVRQRGSHMVKQQARDRKLLTPKQFEVSALQLNECGRMVGGWLKSRGSTNLLT